MADENTRFDVDALGDINKKLRSVGEDLTASFEQMKSTLDEHWGCWGNDELGEGFIKQFEKANPDLQKAAEATGPQHTQMADEIDKQIEAFRQQEEANRSNIEKNDYSG